MAVKPQYERILFGIKVKQLRLKMGLSFAQLSESSGLSLSYLNEIEKGKKYPSKDKSEGLASALGIDPDELLSEKVPSQLEPVAQLLQSNFLNELPLDLFGIELSKIAEIIASAPLKVGAFISTLLEIARNYAVGEEHFYLGAMRTYQELNHNYFEDLEKAAENFLIETDLIEKPHNISSETLMRYLKDNYDYKFDTIPESQIDALRSVRSIYLPEKKMFLLNPELTDYQKAFQLGKELGYNYLNLKIRPNPGDLQRIGSFEEVLNNFRTGYFAVALLIPQNRFTSDLKLFLGNTKWDPMLLVDLMKKYNASPEMLFQRFNVLPHYFGIKNVFFLRFLHSVGSDHYTLDKELHLNQKHHPNANSVNEHYCRRWLSLTQLKELDVIQRTTSNKDYVVGIQRSAYVDTDDEYLVLSIARPAYPTPDKNVCVTIGAKVDDALKRRFKFLEDPAIPRKMVGVTCERCPLKDCVVRAAPPTIIQKKQERAKTQQALEELLNRG